MPTLQQLAEWVQALVPSKWHLDIHHFAEILGVEVEEVNGFIKCIKDGGTGSKTDGSWSSNPAPFNGVVNLKKEVEDPRKGKIQDPNGSYKTSLVAFCKHIVAISKGKAANNISTTRRKRELERAGITEELILMEFVKFDECESLKKKQKEEAAKLDKIKDVIASNGTDVVGERKAISIQEHTISYHHPSAADSDDEDWFGPP